MFKVIFLFFFIVSLAFADLKVETHTASDSGFLVNSHIIMGETEAVLVDAQFLTTEAEEVVKKITLSKKKLTHIVITHAHADHFFGLEVLTKAFPDAKVISASSVVAEMKDKGPKKLAYWKTQYPEKLMPKELVYPTSVLDEKVKEITLKVDNDTLTLKLYGPAESESSVVVLASSIKSVFAGDLLYNKVYLWLQENRPNDWLKNLKRLEEEKDVEIFYAGHGDKGDKKLVEVNRKFIEDFTTIVKKPNITRAEAKSEILKIYPKEGREKKIDGYRLEVILDLALEPVLAK